MIPTHVLSTALESAGVILLVQVAAYIQAKTTNRDPHSRLATRHADICPPAELRRRSTYVEEYPARLAGTTGTQTAGAPPIPPIPSAPAPYTTRHAAQSATWWADPDWPATAADDTHVTEAVT